MEGITQAQVESIKKLSTARLIAKLLKVGYTHEQIEGMDRNTMMQTWAECVADGKDKPEVVAERTFVGYDVDWEREKLQFEKHKFEAEQISKRAEIESHEKLKLAEIESQEKLKHAELKLKEQKFFQECEEKNSIVLQAKQYGEAIKASVTPMGPGTLDVVLFFRHIEAIFERYNVPANLRAALLQPHLNDKSRSVIARLDPSSCSDYNVVRDAILREHKLSPATYLDVFNDLAQNRGETTVMQILVTFRHLNNVNKPYLLPSQKIDPQQIAHLSSTERHDLLELLNKYPECFTDDPGLCTLVYHEINLLPEFRPKRLRAYRVPERLKPKVAEKIQHLLDLGVIRPSNSEMVSPLVVVLKGPGGRDGIRLAVDYSYVNSFTRNDPFPVPYIDSILNRIGKSKLYSSFDASQGYFQTPIRAGDEPLTAFVCDEGIFEFLRTPFGGKSCGSTFIRAVQKIL